MPNAPLIVVIDGPAGAGKSTTARAVARALGLPLLDTGAIYRTLALWARRRGISWEDEDALAKGAQSLPIEFAPSARPEVSVQVRCEGEDVSEAIRTPKISTGASKVSAHPKVRAALLGLQRRLASGGCVAEGRDMGTVVFPETPHKFFLTADDETRARRRLAQLKERGGPVPTLENLLAEMRERDERDSSRAAAPLRQADDALAIDSSGKTQDEVVSEILAHVQRT